MNDKKNNTLPIGNAPVLINEFVEQDEAEKVSEINYDTLVNVQLKPREVSADDEEQEKVVFYFADIR